MPDFDANEDPAILPGAGRGESSQPTEQGPPVIRRTRGVREGHREAFAGRLGPSARSQRARAERRACGRIWRACALRSMPRSRCLWTVCHGRLPGSPS